MSIIDSLFIATNYEVEDMDENPDRALNRYEFIEFLVRLGAFKFKDQSKEVKTFSGAFEILLERHVIPHYSFPPWQEFRALELWQTGPNDVL